MDTYKTVITTTKKIEGLLEKYYKAKGKGLHEKLSSIEINLNTELVKKIRWIATIRNNLIHEDGFELNKMEMDNFIKSSKNVIQQLEKKKEDIWEESFGDIWEESLRKYQNKDIYHNHPNDESLHKHKDSSIFIMTLLLPLNILIDIWKEFKKLSLLKKIWTVFLAILLIAGIYQYWFILLIMLAIFILHLFSK